MSTSLETVPHKAFRHLPKQNAIRRKSGKDLADMKNSEKRKDGSVNEYLCQAAADEIKRRNLRNGKRKGANNGS